MSGNPLEYKIVQIGGELIPLATVSEHADQIPRDMDVVCLL